MANIELVVKISEEDYESIKDDVKKFLSMPSHKVPVLYEAVNKGILLPAGHGDLIDRKALLENGYQMEPVEMWYGIKYADTIIEADTQNKEKEDIGGEDIMPYFTGATLLSVEEAKNVNKEILKADIDWWLCSPGFDGDYAACVFGDYGSVSDIGNYVEDSYGVRPALEISNLESSGYKIGESVYFGGYSFTIISDTYALCDDMIGECAFRKDSKAKDANKYETSDIKRYVETWFEKVKEQSREERDSEEEREF